MPIQTKASDPLILPDDWKERAGLALRGIGFKEFAWHAAYRAGWEECAARSRELMAASDEYIVTTMRRIVATKDAKIIELEKSIAALTQDLD